MSALVERLKNDHIKAVDTLNKIKELGATTKEGQEKLLAAKGLLLAHLKAEDTELYPVMRKEAEKNEALKRILDNFASEMNTISKNALAFFDKYSSGGSGIEFAKDFGGLFATLGARIRKEETVLYPEFDKIVK